MAKAGTVGRLAARTVGHRPLTIHTFHGHVLDGYFHPAVGRAFAAAERVLARHTDALVAVSDEIRDQLLDLGIGRPGQFHVIPLGLDLEPFLAVAAPSGALRSRLGIEPGTPLVGAVGRLVPIKDHATLFEAMTLVPSAHLAVVGDGELRSQLEALVDRHGLSGRVHFTGWVTDVAAAMGDLDVVVLTSRNEGTPVALIEASAAARPVVATDVGGVRSVVADGRTGVVVAPGDPQAVAGAIAGLLADPAARERLGGAGRESVRRRFGQERLLEDVTRLYDEMLSAKARIRA
jgi:glycosyltransferase involved in cell wall biosynthesis